MEFKHIIFDLDGTLIDSAPSIISALKNTLAKYGVNAENKINKNIIGPSLEVIFKELTGKADKELTSSMIETFKMEYDTCGYKETRPYPGITDVIENMIKNKKLLYIATNKRMHPTMLILDRLGWMEKIEKIYTLDCVQPTFQNKIIMLRQIKKEIMEKPNQMITYIGDKNDDGIAADINSIPFHKVMWGYGESDKIEENSGWVKINKVEELLRI
jgi:phosphoglycolate phosphatase